MGALALPKNEPLPNEWPLPGRKVPPQEVESWRAQRDLANESRPIITLSPGAVGAGKAWPAGHYAELAQALIKDGASVWILGGPNESSLATQIEAAAGSSVRNFTSADLRNAILALAAADISVTNDSGLMHVSAALGTATVAIFGPTSPWHWKPLNPIAAILEPPGNEDARTRARIEGNDAVRHRRTDDVAVETVHAAVRRILAEAKNRRK
jgi:heptosyltransferase-2